ncbi:putative F-box protein At1g33530 [Triticum dicoccoides]|uniref:putative F-box protein At1g33530 n=1 Tax=Triticum dicoccoides TaxID=85692 RepID=UPI00188DFEFD|nr:putative F-box protein At1g33530 [Triticum dicoccoides]
MPCAAGHYSSPENGRPPAEGSLRAQDAISPLSPTSIGRWKKMHTSKGRDMSAEVNERSRINKAALLPDERRRINKAASLPDERRSMNKAASLPDEMIIEVLQLLPIKSVLRFRAVCRSWDALLSSDEFRSLHLAARREPLKLLYISPTARFLSTAVYARSFTPSSSGGSTGDRGHLLFTIDGARGNCVEVVTPVPCCGLTLLYDALAMAYYICNPATRATTRLPPSTDIASRSTTGLGFDARTKEHKVVRLINGMCHDKVGVRCEVYTPGGRHGDRWRHVAGGVPSSLRQLVSSAVTNASLNKLPPVFANGCLHWLMDPITSRVAIICFSITEETFTCAGSPPFWVPAPRPTSRPWSSGEHLVEMHGQLYMVRDLRNRVMLFGDLETAGLWLRRMVTASSNQILRTAGKRFT